MPSRHRPLALSLLDPGHFHAALVLGAPNPDVHDEIRVYAPEGPELADFLALVEAFNRRAERPTSWRPVVRHCSDPLGTLVAEGHSDAVVLAGRTAGKVARIRALHDAGLPVLADKPWLVGPEGLDDLRHALGGGPLAMEMMTGRHEIAAILLERVVADPDVFGGFRAGGAGEPAISLGSVHHLAKVVNGAPLRRPAWYFDVRQQGDGLADIPTHLVDRAQRLVAAARAGRPEDAEIAAARTWPTMVPRDVWTRVTGAADFSPDLAGAVKDGALAYLANAELRARIGGVLVEMATRWDLVEPPGGGDMHAITLRGTHATVRVEQGAATGFRRRIAIQPVEGGSAVASALARAVAAWQTDLPGVAVAPAADGFELRPPDGLRAGHESHFALVLREFAGHLERGSWPPEIASRTLAKYRLLADAMAICRSGG